MDRGKSKAALAAVLTAGFLAASAGQASAVPGVVDTSTDGNDGECLVDCTLREAVSLAAIGDTVTFLNAGVDPALELGQIFLATDITIDGLGATSTTIDASTNAPNDRAFELALEADPAVIKELTITGGNAPDGTNGVAPSDPGSDGFHGGAISSFGNLTLDSVTITGNQAGDGGGGAAGAPATANAGGNGGVGGYGGGVFSNGTLTIIDSTISGNAGGDGGSGAIGGIPPTGVGGPGGSGGTGGAGGGITALGTLTITDSTIGPNNVAGDGGPGGPGGTVPPGPCPVGCGPGGAGGDGGIGGGIALSATTTATNSTFHDNDAGNGGSGGSGAATPALGGDGGSGGGVWSELTIGGAHLTIAGNSTGAVGGVGPLVPAPGDGGGIFNDGGTATLTNSIVANNTSVDPAANANCAGGITNGGGLYSVAFPEEGCVGFVVGDPLLGPLASNGGPTQTMAIGAGGTAVDGVGPITSSCAATDQRGVSRPQPAGGLCDVGAFELEQASPPVVTPPVGPAAQVPATTRRKKCKKGRKLRRGKCVKKKRKT